MIHYRLSIVIASLLCAAVAPTALAQRAAPAAVTGGRAFATEALGGTIGSAVGIAIGLAIARPDACPSDDDVACPLQRLGIVGIIGVAGATIGTNLAGRLAGSRPSLVGALLGAGVGAAVGVGVEHFVTEEMNQTLGNTGTLMLFSVAQGILAAAGSRLGAALRRD